MAQALLALNSFTGNYGLAIILLTIATRLFLLPLTIKQVKSMKSLQRLQPELKKIQQKYKDDKQKQQQELMKFYAEHKVNPFAGCLPLLLQLPVFIALFSVLRKRTAAQLKEQAVTVPVLATVGEALAKASFLGLTLGSSMQSMVSKVGKSITVFSLIPYIILIGVMMISHYFHSKAMGSGDQSQVMMMRAMLIFMGYFAYILPTGLVIYWVTTNIIGIIEHYLINRFSASTQPVKEGA